MQKYKGTFASEGLVMGPVYRPERQTMGLGRVVHGPSQERALFDAAVVLAKDELRQLQQKAVGEQKDILRFQHALLEDRTLIDEVGDYIAVGADSAAAVDRAASIFTHTLENVDDAYIRERSADVVDVCRRVVDILDGRPRGKLELTRPSIIVADQVLPSDILSVEPGMLLGIVTSSGSIQSHASIIAGVMGIPAVVGLGSAFLDAAMDGATLLLDAEAGDVVLEPDRALQAEVRGRLHRQQERAEEMGWLRNAPCRTKDGTAVSLLANCSGPQDIEAAVQTGAEGVGLLRSEFLLMKGQFPDEEEQYRFYVDCLRAAAGRPVTVRTFDIGADKAVDGLSEPEPNPALGLRGLRFCLSRPELFHTQLCALLRASAQGPLRVMFPMVGGVEDWREAMACVATARAALRTRGAAFDERLLFGSMIEIPSAALTAGEIAAHGCGFFSIGTNDLVQYTQGADRMAPGVARYYREDGPAVRILIGMTLDAAQRAGIPVCICGQTASDPALAAAYVRQGLRSLSVTGNRLLKVKNELMNLDLAAEADAPGAGLGQAGTVSPGARL